jgi:hypothetical protein
MPGHARLSKTTSRVWSDARSRAAESLDATTAIAILAFAVSAWLGLQGRGWPDWAIEARPSVDALLRGHLSGFFRDAPPYGGSLLLRAPFMALTRLWGGGGVAVYRAGALPCLAAAAALAFWLSSSLKRRGCSQVSRIATVAVCLASPLAIITLQQGHPEELLGAVLCVAAVLCAQRDHALWSGFLVGLAIANKEWGVLAVGPVLVALPRHRGQALAAMVASAGVVLAPFVLVRAGGFVGQTESVALHSDSIFSPLQLWWFFGTPAHGGVRLGPAWLAEVGHTLPIAIMFPLTLIHARRARRWPGRRRRDAMLLLAALLLLRCVLDPWDLVYYPLPFLTALLAWETTSFDRPPFIALSGSLITWFVFQGATYVFGGGQNTLAVLFTATVVPAICVIFRCLLARPAAPAHAPSTGRRSSATEIRDIHTPPLTLS